MIEKLTVGEILDFLKDFVIGSSELKGADSNEKLCDQGVFYDPKREEMTLLVDSVRIRVPAHLGKRAKGNDFDNKSDRIDRFEIYRSEKIYLSEDGIGFENEDFKNYILKINDVSEEDFNNEWKAFLLGKENMVELERTLGK